MGKKEINFPPQKQRCRVGNLSLSELMTIVLYFYLSLCKDFKNYYLHFLSSKYSGYFKLVNYSRIIQLWPTTIAPLAILLNIL